jgi:hypothetical protein
MFLNTTLFRMQAKLYACKTNSLSSISISYAKQTGLGNELQLYLPNWGQWLDFRSGATIQTQIYFSQTQQANVIKPNQVPRYVHDHRLESRRSVRRNL